MARPHKEIGQKEFEQLCGLQCTKEEICAFFDVTDKTLDGWCRRTYRKNFSVVFAEKRGIGKISLRRSQFRLAERNPTMAIFLGKQYLDQKDEARMALSFSDVEDLTPLAELLGDDDDDDNEDSDD